LFAKQLLGALTTWLLGRINSARPKQPNEQPDIGSPHMDSRLRQYILMYLCSSLLAIILECVFNLFTSSGKIRASQTLFRSMTSRIIRMPILWLDNTPIGEMLKLYNRDIRFVDYQVLNTLSEFSD